MLINLGWMLISLGRWPVASGKFAGLVALGETAGGSRSGLAAPVRSLDSSSLSGCLKLN